jgi:hypothetical protein
MHNVGDSNCDHSPKMDSCKGTLMRSERLP